MRRGTTTQSDVPFWIRDLRGVNKLASADRIRDNEFDKLQNWVHTNKGALYKRPGSSSDLTATDLTGASRVTGVHRHYNPGGDRFTIYHCRPNTTPLPQPSTDLTLTEINGGDLFNGGGVQTMRFCYTWVGMGLESNWNTNQRAGYVPYSGSPINAWSQTGLQAITVSAASKGVRVTVPAFPNGVRAANIFCQRGTTTQMTYVGTVRTSGGTLDVTQFLGPSAAASDSPGTLSISTLRNPAASLAPGQYWIAVAWWTETGAAQGALIGSAVPMILQAGQPVNLTGSENQINVSRSGGASTNGATYMAVFLGRQDPRIHPMTFMGLIKADGSQTLNITAFVDNVNAQSAPIQNGASLIAAFSQLCRMGDSQNTERYGFLLKKRPNGSISEVMFSRSELDLTSIFTPPSPFTATASSNEIVRTGRIKTDNDTFISTNPYPWNGTYSEPQFAYLNGLTYLANGLNLLLQTDGYTLASMYEALGTVLPPIPRFVAAFKGGLVCGGYDNQIYASNVAKPNNWVVGGTGTALRFITIGDPFGDGLAALHVYAYDTSTSGRKTFLTGFKKNTCWMASDVPDPVSGIGAAMDQLSGKVGTTAYRSIANTPLGVIFFAADGNFYLIRGVGEPVPIGWKVKDYFSHIPASETLMKMMTAVYHDGFYKVSYPGSASSTSNDSQFYADLRTSADDSITWSGPHIGISVGAQTVNSGENDDMARVCGLSNTARAAKLDDTSTYQDLGSPIVSTIGSKLYRHGSELILKRYLGLAADVYFDSSFTHSLLFEGFADEDYQARNVSLSTGGAVWDSSSYDAGLFGSAFYQLVNALFGASNLLGRIFRFQITHSDNANIIIAGIGAPYSPERRRIA